MTRYPYLKTLTGYKAGAYRGEIEGGRIPPSCETGAGRFWRKTVVESSGCWRWTGRPTSAGYGVIAVRNRRLYAHRFAYESHVGPIPEGLTIDHLCRNRMCVNPAHLEPVTLAENLRRSPFFDPYRRVCRKRGHPLTPENLYVRPSGHRMCRACRQITKLAAA